MIEVLLKKNVFEIFIQDFSKIAQYYAKELLNKFTKFIEESYLIQ